MGWYRTFLQNHVLANLAFALILVVGMMTFAQMPRERDPEMNFNWINITTVLPGASATDIEKRITDPIEDAINGSVRDIDFITSTSRENVSSMLIRFNQLDDREFDKRVADLRREVQNAYNDQLPDDAEDPQILEITSSNGFPTATIAVRGLGTDENFRRAAVNIKKELEQYEGIDSASALGLYDPELHIRFYPEKLEGLGIAPSDISDTVASYFNDVSIGDLETVDGKWVIRMQGTDSDPETLADYPIVTGTGVITLGSVADIVYTTQEPSTLLRYNGQPAVSFTITKTADTNVLELLDELRAYVDRRNETSNATGVEVILIDDQTVSTRSALALMQNNALIGLLLVLVVTWAFLGVRISVFTSIGIPLTLAGTFFTLNLLGMTVNNSVLLGVVIALGMIVDDAVVVVETMYYRMQRGSPPLDAAVESLKEVFAPVSTSVLTTIAAFLPLTLLPGILGDFMRVIPLTVCIALLVSLIEAYWMLPVHITHAPQSKNREPGKMEQVRQQLTRRLRMFYTKWLVKSLRHPVVTALAVTFILILAVAAAATGLIRFNFFAGDPSRLFYVNVEMPKGSSLEQTLARTLAAEQRTLALLEDGELRGSIAYSGLMFTQTEPLYGDNIGQVMISLLPRERGGREVSRITDIMENTLVGENGENITILRIEDGPPVSRAISVKVRGDNFDDILSATNDLQAFMAEAGVFANAANDFRPGNPELVLQHNGEAIQRAGLSPLTVTRAVQAYVDGELVSQFQADGEEVLVRVKSVTSGTGDVDQLLRQTIPVPNGGAIALGNLLDVTYTEGRQSIRHHNYRRTITIESDLDEDQINTVEANEMLMEYWETIRTQHPGIDLDFSGELDDINESMSAIGSLFLIGLGLIYLILGTQFRSYWQPFLIIFGTLPLAATGVVIGLLITQNPMSLYTLYGVVALAGIAVNSAIVLISAANDRVNAGMSLEHAVIYASRRRVIPILITSLTTIAGLFSLAAGIAGKSLIWGPVATAIVSGLLVSTLLTLFVIPLLYRVFMAFSPQVRANKTNTEPHH